MTVQEKEQFKKIFLEWLKIHLNSKGKDNLYRYEKYYLNSFLNELKMQFQNTKTKKFVLLAKESEDGKEKIFNWDKASLSVDTGD